MSRSNLPVRFTGPEQRGQRAPVGLGHPAGPVRFGQDAFDQDRVEVHERGLQEVKREHRDLGVLAVRAGHDASEFFQRLVGGVLGAAASSEPAALLTSREICPYVGGSSCNARQRAITALRSGSRRHSVGHSSRDSHPASPPDQPWCTR